MVPLSLLGARGRGWDRRALAGPPPMFGLLLAGEVVACPNAPGDPTPSPARHVLTERTGHEGVTHPVELLR